MKPRHTTEYLPLTKPYITGREYTYVRQLIADGTDLSGDGVYTQKVHRWLEERYRVPKVLLTTSCTTALELSLRLVNLKPGDEVIAPSFTFSSTINAILLNAGVRVRFADIEPSTLTIDPKEIKRLVTNNTKAVVVVHYAGVCADMDPIMDIARSRKLTVVEDAAQAIESTYRGKHAGTIGDFGCFSFHSTKNVTCGEGGALLINTVNSRVHEHAEIIREKGTNRSKFLKGLVDKYSWVDLGNSYLPSDILAAFLLAQLEHIGTITSLRRKRYAYYYRKIEPLARRGLLRMPVIPPGLEHNGHIFFILLPSVSVRDTVMNRLRAEGIGAAFHYIPLHTSPYGRKVAFKPGRLPVTQSVAGRLLRLPLYAQMTRAHQDRVIEALIHALE